MARTAVTQPRRTGNRIPAMFFQGPSQGYVNSGFTRTYALADSFTWELFVKCGSHAAAATMVGVIHEAGANDPICGINLTTGGLANVGLRDVDGQAPAGNSTTRIDDNRWHHLALVRNKATGKLDLFVDGVRELNNTDSTTGSITLGSAVFIGARNGRGTPDQYFRGSIQHVRFSNFARYTANFTRPSYNAPYGVDSHTELLLTLSEAPSTPIDATGTSTASVVNTVGKDPDSYFNA